MSSIVIKINNADGDKCGGCATSKWRTYGDGTKIARLWCNTFQRYLPDSFNDDSQITDRLPECIAAEKVFLDSLRG
jgi:hypothetical protein